MCWEFEDEYGICFDFLCTKWGERIVKPNIITVLEKQFNVKFNDYDTFDLQWAIFDILSEMHKRKQIEPRKKHEWKKIGDREILFIDGKLAKQNDSPEIRELIKKENARSLK